MIGPPVDMTVDVTELLKDYKGNELRGDNKYKGKRVRIIGKAREFKRDVSNAIYMTVGTGAQLEIPEAQCFFGDEYAGWVSSLTKGSTVVIDCTVEGLMMNVLLKNCSGIAGTDTLNACYKLRDAGAAKGCSPEQNSASFNTSDMPTIAATSLAAKEWAERSVGSIFRVKDDEDYEQALARLNGRGVGSASARIVVVLPVRASPDLLPRVKAVVDRLPPAYK